MTFFLESEVLSARAPRKNAKPDKEPAFSQDKRFLLIEDIDRNTFTKVIRESLKDVLREVLAESACPRLIDRNVEACRTCRSFIDNKNPQPAPTPQPMHPADWKTRGLSADMPAWPGEGT